MTFLFSLFWNNLLQEYDQLPERSHLHLLPVRAYLSGQYIWVIGQVRYSNILTWLRGFQDKLLYWVLFSLYPSRSLLGIERQKKLKKNYNFEPKASELC